jgi:proline iminopeptidase
VSVALVLQVSTAAPQAAAVTRESRVPVDQASLYAREIGQGPPIIVLHGGPDFDHGYLLPDLDRLADAFRLIYYDQRGRGRSAERVVAEDVTMMSEVQDLDRVRQHFQLRSTALLGHSWGAVLALEFALRNSQSVSRMILMNPAPVSARHVALFRKAYIEKMGADFDRQKKIVASEAYQQADPEAVTSRYRLHFKSALVRPRDYERLMTRMKAGFIIQGKAGIVKARAVEDRLMRDTWQMHEYDLLPKLRSLRVPTLVISGDRDFIPGDIAEAIARNMPTAQLVSLRNCGHFAYLECPGEVRNAMDTFFRRTTAEAQAPQ